MEPQRRAARFQALKFRLPDIDGYQDRKSVFMTPSSMAPMEEELATCVFLRRIEAALSVKRAEPPEVFPGSLIPAHGRPSAFINRGSFFLEQFLYYKTHGWSNQPMVVAHSPAKTANRMLWPWNVAEPELRFVRARPLPHHPTTDIITNRLHDHLNRIHRNWDCADGIYSNCVLAALEPVLTRALAAPTTYARQAALFEIEAAASYLSCTESLPVLLQSRIGQTWVGVYTKPLATIKQTELCVTERIFDELFNLTRFCFAPIVVNEYSTVADGNHRLTSAWIWNILRRCLDTDWDIDSPQFQIRITEAIRHTGLFEQPVTLHETLAHLAVLLSRRDLAQALANRLKPVMAFTCEITEVPVVIVPEYSSGASNKHLYDSGRAIQRAHPLLYRTIAEAPDLVLPPRSSYHYTDCVPLPWFDVIN